MKVFPLLFLSLLILAAPSHGELNLEQELLIIPDTHDYKPYVWNVARDPKGYELNLEYGRAAAGAGIEFSFTVEPAPPEIEDNLHVFIVDRDLHEYAHLRPVKTGGKYRFNYNPQLNGAYRLEVVFKTPEKWINLKKDITVKDGKGGKEREKDEGYGAKVKIFPKKIYSEHVATFVYELSYKGEPLKGLEKIDGFDMQVASWDRDLKDFIFAVPKQNLGGHEVGVSIVFMRAGRRAVFAEFKHNGLVRKVEMVVDVHEEPAQDRDFIIDLKPSE